MTLNNLSVNCIHPSLEHSRLWGVVPECSGNAGEPPIPASDISAATLRLAENIYFVTT